jgi:hypothetical protein
MRLVAATQARAADVQVCVEGTTFCTFVDDDGVFTLAADVGGDVTLVFTGPDFVARVTLTAFRSAPPCGSETSAAARSPERASRTISRSTAATETRSAIRCEHGPDPRGPRRRARDRGRRRRLHPDGRAVRGDHRGRRIVLEDARAACGRRGVRGDPRGRCGASSVTPTANGIVAAGNSAVHLDAAAGGHVDIPAGGVGRLSEGTALIALAGDQCRDRRRGKRAPHPRQRRHRHRRLLAVIDLIGGEEDDTGRRRRLTRSRDD